MEPVKHSQHNFTFRGPEPGIGDLSVTRVQERGRMVVRSHWKPSDVELQQLIAGGTVEIAMYTEIIPPLSVNVAPEDRP